MSAQSFQIRQKQLTFPLRKDLYTVLSDIGKVKRPLLKNSLSTFVCQLHNIASTIRLGFPANHETSVLEIIDKSCDATVRQVQFLREFGHGDASRPSGVKIRHCAGFSERYAKCPLRLCRQNTRKLQTDFN